MKITVIGTGYVGLVTGTCLSELGNDIVCVDVDEKKISSLNNGEVPIYEPGLNELIERNAKEKRLLFSTNLNEAIKSAEIIFICVGTPSKESGDADLSYVENVARQIAESAEDYKVIVEKSTVPVETGKKIAQTVKAYNPHNIEFDVVSNPEFLKEGSAVNDFMSPDRIVIGVNSKKAEEIMKKLYAPLKAPVIVTNRKSAEIIKHASNSFLATKISFINAVSNICEKVGANIEQVAEGMGYDKRIGKHFLRAGIGYGGSCFPKDVDAFIKISEKIGYDFDLLKEVQNTNEKQKQIFIKKIEDAIWNAKNKTIGVLGLAFKPNTDDMRRAPSIDVIKALQKEGAKIKAYDPEAIERAKEVFKDITYCDDPYEVAKDADALVILTEWNEFKELDLKKIKGLLKQPLIIDGRNIYNPEELKKEGFKYISVGR
ncbi:UDP-glucose/GDP-mannose dehydrogenase family protein [Candidatus Woesearchaeota archaeon]|nr:UDP-glucose/GDP-mannose dehydrogenase family protein [Candidatus Woesearchaeota archaeon]